MVSWPRALIWKEPSRVSATVPSARLTVKYPGPSIARSSGSPVLWIDPWAWSRPIDLRGGAGTLGGGRAGDVDLVVEQFAEAHPFGLVAGGGGVGEVVADRVELLLLGFHPRCGGVQSFEHHDTSWPHPSREPTWVEAAWSVWSIAWMACWPDWKVRSEPIISTIVRAGIDT